MAKKKGKKKNPKALDPKKDFGTPVRTPRQARLPEMDDPKIEALHGLAESYVEIRNERQALTKKEVELKGKLLDLLKAHKKEHYHFGGLDITVIHEKEKVRVRLASGNATGEDAEEGDE